MYLSKTESSRNTLWIGTWWRHAMETLSDSYLETEDLYRLASRRRKVWLRVAHSLILMKRNPASAFSGGPMTYIYLFEASI